MGWLRPFGLNTRVLIDLDEENLNLMSVCSESFIFDRFRARNRTYVRTYVRTHARLPGTS